MKKFFLLAAVCMLSVLPGCAPGAQMAKKVKEDSKVQVQVLKDKGYKALDNEKIDESVKSFLTAKYNDRGAVEVIGKATSKDLNEARAMARQDALAGYDPADIGETFFVYKKSRRQFEVVCYSLVKGSAASAARRNATQLARQYENTEAQIAEAKAKAAREKAEKERKKAQKQADKARKKAEKARKEAQKQAKKAKEELKNAENYR